MKKTITCIASILIYTLVASITPLRLRNNQKGLLSTSGMKEEIAGFN